MVKCYSETEKDSNGKKKNLTRGTALYYIRKHLYHYDQLLRDKDTKKRRAEDFGWAFDRFEAGSLKKQRFMEAEDNMRDLLETNEEIALYDMTKKIRNTPLFDMSASAECLSYFLNFAE